MTEKLAWNVTITATGGPRLTYGGELEVDAYDKLSVTVPGTKEVTVDLGPSKDGRIECLVIAPETPSDELSYSVGAGNSAVPVRLDAPQFLFGGAVTLTGNLPTLVLKNADAADAVVSIFVGRTATAPSP